MGAKRVRKATKLPEFPVSIRQGSAEVKIYQTPVTVGGKRYQQFTVAYYLGAKRVRQRFADFEEARTEANAAAIKLANGEFAALKLNGSDSAILPMLSRPVVGKFEPQRRMRRPPCCRRAFCEAVRFADAAPRFI